LHASLPCTGKAQAIIDRISLPQADRIGLLAAYQSHKHHTAFAEALAMTTTQGLPMATQVCLLQQRQLPNNIVMKFWQLVDTSESHA